MLCFKITLYREIFPPVCICSFDLFFIGRIKDWANLMSQIISFWTQLFLGVFKPGWNNLQALKDKKLQRPEITCIFTYYFRPDTFIGVIDIGKENTWTQLDGTKIDSSFTNTFDLNNNQPNGGNSQNCIVMDMEPHHYFRPDKTQDKSCFSSFKTTAMICYADKKGTWFFPTLKI